MVVFRRCSQVKLFSAVVVVVGAGTTLLMLLATAINLPPPPVTIKFLKVPLRTITASDIDDSGGGGGGGIGGGGGGEADSAILLHQQQQQQSSACGLARWKEGLPPLYIVTPTYPRAEQLPEITRTAQTLLNVPNVVWIVSEDAPQPTAALTQYLSESPLNSVYLRAQMPAKYHKVKNKPRGVANRLAGLSWIRQNAGKGSDGVLYFADDDNTYDIRIFEQMRWTRKVSMFPVGLVTNLGVSTPIVRQGKVVGFYDGWIANRKFPVDMAGFAVSVHFLLSRPNATMPFTVGYEEDGFIRSLGITSSDIEPLAFNCTKIWVWHTQTKKNTAAKPVAQNNVTMGSNLDVIKTQLWKDPKAPASPSPPTPHKKSKKKS